MRRLSILVCAVLAALAVADAAFAQIIPRGGSKFDPAPPPPPPSPRIEVPVIPQMDAPPRQSYQSAPRPSFSDRINSCLDEGAAAGLGPGDREACSRACANR
jgi:hypothetical protein